MHRTTLHQLSHSDWARFQHTFEGPAGGISQPLTKKSFNSKNGILYAHNESFYSHKNREGDLLTWENIVPGIYHEMEKMSISDQYV